jgi:hypothetical protein
MSITGRTVLHFTDEREYRRTVETLARDGPRYVGGLDRDVTDLCECQNPKGAHTVTLADALTALDTARRERGRWRAGGHAHD